MDNEYTKKCKLGDHNRDVGNLLRLKDTLLYVVLEPRAKIDYWAIAVLFHAIHLPS